MVQLDTSLERTDGVTFVRATVTNTRGTAQLVRVESRLDGPTWPPRRDGFTAPEWDGNCWEKGLLPGRCHGFGFASPAEPVDPPLEVVAIERIDPEELRSVEEVLAGLDSPFPPREILQGRR